MNWINVNDVLPESNTDVLVFAGGHVYRSSRRWNGNKIVWCVWNQDAGLGIQPTHWTPFKEPKKVKDNEKI